MRDTGLVIVSNYWNELQWVLPVLVKMKELEPNLKLCVVFKNQELWSQGGRNLGIVTQLDKVVDRYEIGASPDLDPSRVRFVMKDYSRPRADRFKDKICFSYKGAKIVVYPHSTVIEIAQTSFVPNEEYWKLNSPSAHDLMLVPTEYDLEWWSQRMPSNTLKAVGFPRYDDWWIKTLTASLELLDSKEREVSKQYKAVMWATRGPNLDLSRYVYFPEEVHDYLVHSTAEVILEDPDNFLIIRPHPQQDARSLQGLADLLSGHDRWMITNLQPMQVASIAGICITMWTSCVLDSLAAEAPVIEFCQYPVPSDGFVTLEDGSIGSTFTYLGLTKAVTTKEQLRDAFYSDYNEFYPREQKNFSSLMIKDASKVAALEILE